VKNSTWKKLIFAGLGMLLIAGGIFYYTAHGKRPFITAIDPAFSAYVTSYTAGVISSGSAIRVVLAEDAVDSASVGRETSVKLFEFSPSVQGTTRWLDRRTVEFKPDRRLISGQIYEIRFFLSKVHHVSKELATLEYSFQIIPQHFELRVENIRPYIKTELGRQKIEGVLLTADFAESGSVEQILQAHQDGKSLKVSWTHSPEGKQHLFVVDNVSRGDSASHVLIAAKGESLGISQTDEREMEIPALSDFKVVQVKVEQSGNQHVVLQFSDPLDEKQNLEGLISITDLASLDFEIKDNEIHVYPPVKQTGTKTLTLEMGVRNILNYKMKEGSSFEVVFEQLKPEVRFVGKGTILPGTEGLVMPFEAVNLKSVDLEIIKVYENNVVQFLQVNDLDGNSELRRVGKPILKKNISLESAGVTDIGKWNRFTLDLASLIQTEPGAIYQVRLSFKKSYLAYFCDDGGGEEPQVQEEEDWSQVNENSNWDSYEDYYYGEDYDWKERDNPCSNSYYTSQRNIKRNVIASDLGLLAKRGSDGTTVLFVNDLKTTQPVVGVQLEMYDYQQQLIGSTSTGTDGKAVIASHGNPFVLIAKNGQQRGYLKLQDGESLSLSSFDVGGEQIKKGLKGFLYGERGVWRPGDSLYLTFMLEDKLHLLPANHPVVLELQNPQGQVTARTVQSSSVNGFYKFATATSPDAPTGNWLGRVKVGGADFTTPLKIETVKPNRLKIKLDFGVDKLTAGSGNISGNLNVNWLQGSPGKNLKAQFEVLLTRAETHFQRYPEFSFDDPSRDFTSESKSVFEGYTDENGNATVRANLDVTDAAPGMLNAIFRGKVFEESGNFSVDRWSMPYYPYTSFTGIRLPAGDKARGMLLTDTTQHVDVVTVDADGKPVSHQNIEMSIYKIQWRWWWDHSGESATNFMSGQYSKLVSTGKIETVNGKGSWDFKIKYPEWGRYFVRAYDPVSGHSTGKIIYVDWPGWAGRSRGGNENATMLAFSSDKPAYTTGEKMNLTIPGSDHGRALISIENGSRVIKTFWLETKKGDNAFPVEVTAEMTPNIFVHVTLLQPHDQTGNDLPIRLYGVIPVQVEDPGTRITPVLETKDVFEPDEEIRIKVSEKAGHKMTYTLAVVEEGLLDLTHFKTPDPWNRFYAREALGVKTWDLYDQVMGSFGGKLERLLAIGGDGLLSGKAADAKANRFKPVVKFLGPFTLDGGVAEHRFVMPSYIGSVRVMVVAGFEGAYGNAEKTVPVRKPLMVLATLPRVLGPGETLKLPVTLFSMEKNIRDVKVDVKTSGPLRLTSSPAQSTTMNGTDKTIEFDLSVKPETGKATVEVTATSGKYQATNTIEIEIRNPNLPVSRMVQAIVEPGQSWTTSVVPVGVVGTNSATLEVSTLPPINLGQRLAYLIQYPYGCIEQTTSSVFPQLYMDQVKALNGAEKAVVETNVKAGIERLKLFVTRDGGFAYWPGGDDSESWGSTYAGHFLMEAEAKGYFIPQDMIQKWKRYQRHKAQSWRMSDEIGSTELIQAYRLYTLALAGEPELGAMNRLREQGSLSATASWMLAAAYWKVGQPEACKQLIINLPLSVKPYQEMAYSFGSDLRDKAIILETLVLMGDRVRGFDLVKEISKELSNPNSWMSTQTLSWCLKSVGQWAGKEPKGELNFSYNFNGKEIAAGTKLPLAQASLPLTGNEKQNLKFRSASTGSLYVRIITQGTPARGMEADEEEGLSMNVSYTDMDGKALDPSQLEQGQEFVARVSATNPGYRGMYKNLVLNQIFPSGWEINNLRLDDAESKVTGDKPAYQDIRDDRVYTYFDLPANQRKTFNIILTASYAGTFYLPAVGCEAMYDHGIYSRKKGLTVIVVKALANP
jgi:alpha-2-macroglobulin